MDRCVRCERCDEEGSWQRTGGLGEGVTGTDPRREHQKPTEWWISQALARTQGVEARSIAGHHGASPRGHCPPRGLEMDWRWVSAGLGGGKMGGEGASQRRGEKVQPLRALRAARWTSGLRCGWDWAATDRVALVALCSGRSRRQVGIGSRGTDASGGMARPGLCRNVPRLARLARGDCGVGTQGRPQLRFSRRGGRRAGSPRVLDRGLRSRRGWCWVALPLPPPSPRVPCRCTAGAVAGSTRASTCGVTPGLHVGAASLRWSGNAGRRVRKGHTPATA
jgi:hypothetical protein